MYFFKKITLIIIIGITFSSSAKGFLSVPLLYPIQNAKQFNETSLYFSGVRISWVFSKSYFPEHVQELIGDWHVQLGGGWLHTIPRKQDSSSKSQKNIKTFVSYYPAVATAGFNWEVNYLHYVRPIFGVGYAINNPLENNVLIQNSFLDKKSYYITAGVLLSFDIIDSNFSHRMNYEYNIRDMGLFFEYQRYYSLVEKNNRRSGWNIGFFMAF